MLDEPLLGVSLARLFPDLFSMPRPITTPDVPVIVAASVLSIYDAPMLPIVKVGDSPTIMKDGVELFQAIGSQPIIRLLTATRPSEYYKILWKSCETTSIWIGSLGFDDTLDKLLRVFELTGFGDAKVDAPPSPPALVTLTEVASLYRERKLKCQLSVKDVASPAVFVDPETPLVEAMNTMCEKKIRRLFLSGKAGRFVSDRNILAFLFSPKGLKIARDSPDFWTDLRISEMDSKTARPISPDAKVEDVGRMLEAGRDVFMLSDELSLVSRWDLVMKPWKAGKLRLSV
jgi:CBS domain-containing protein